MGRFGLFSSRGSPARSASPNRRAGRPTGRRRGWSVAGQAFVWQLTVLLLLVVAATIALALKSTHDAQTDARDRALAVAAGFAHAPGLVQALQSHDPTAELQPLTLQAQQGSGVDFVDVLSKDGIRYTDPDPGLIGQRAQGDIARAAAGQSFTEVFKGSPQSAVRALVPVKDAHGNVVGLVSTGVQTTDVAATANRQQPLLLGLAGGALVIAGGGALLVSNRLRRQTHGLGPVEMTRMYEHHDAVLHSVREGVLILDAEMRLVLANDEAQHLLGLAPDAPGLPLDELGLEPGMAGLLASGRTVTDEVHPAGDRLLAVNLRPTQTRSGPSGYVATLRDTTELLTVADRAEEARERLKLLYDAGMRIGTTLDVSVTAQELADVAVPRLADFVSVNLVEDLLSGNGPVPGPVTGAVLRRVANRSVLDGAPEAVVEVGEADFYTEASPQARCLETGRSELHQVEDPAIGAWLAQDPARSATCRTYGIHSWMVVPVIARGTTLGVVDFLRSRHPEPFAADDLALAEELVARAAVCLDNAHRFTREHTAALTLQHSLLPRRLPEQSAVEAAFRYLPADPRLGVGGDWFDVIPLSGARVALVVGDVVGHGLQASATMGQLRSAVRTLSDADLPPDELLTHLDDLVIRLAADTDTDTATGPDRTPVADVGATCLYAVYDPVSGRCSLARAGHPPPAVAHPDGTASVLELPAGPPLGLGGLPFEAVETVLPEGSLLALYTDGLVENRQRAIDVGLDSLRRALAASDGSLDALCDHIVTTLLPERPVDDAALLVARVRRLDDDRVASWDVPADPAAVAGMRAEASRRLAAWGLDEAGFVTELVISELVTNAIRYGREPIQLRLIHPQPLTGPGGAPVRTLICEVSDGSGTAPHLRRARTFDEGGRGLLLVAQLTQRWGTRQTANGKTIWCEQTLLPED
ncbi:SpoIIE family protein phosphatase [Streptacidiphilus anmyonensis]|uniref:SpoIIE family protein phosphatase n=1 Tax=Streptacidiphilus anmyonensis TaxID=405782 RepID=UPI0005A6C333|nr:SpoIIE family protein phosphatase [Streptacidiphilus anmyonensis]